MPNLGLASLRVAERYGRSVVVEQYSQAPLQLHRPLYPSGSTTPTVYLKTPSSGLLEGDEHRLMVRIEEGSALQLHTQAATLVYPGTSVQDFEIDIASGAALCFMPHPLILSAGARFAQKVRVNMSSDSFLRYSDSWYAGRIAMGECWQFEYYSNSLQIYVDEKLCYAENWTLTPLTTDLRNPLLCGKNTKFLSVFEMGKTAQSSGLRGQAPYIAEENAVRWFLSRESGKIMRVAWH